MSTDLDLWDRRVAVADARMEPETRDPKAATGLLNYSPPGQPMTVEWNAGQATREGYLANVVAFRCVQIIANTIASLPFRAGPDMDDRSRWSKDAPLAKLLGPAPGGPAPKLSARKLWAWTIAQRIVAGRNAWEVELAGDRPVALWPLVADNLDAIPSTSGVEWFRGFTYGPAHAPVSLTPDRVFYGWDPAPHDFRQPLSALQAARYDLSIAIQADRYSWSFLRNGSVPAAVVITGQFPDDNGRRRFRNQWNAQYRGPGNAGKTAFHEVEEGGAAKDAIHVQTLGLAQKDAQLLETHRAALEMVAIDLGVPWSKLDASGRTFDNASQEDRTFWEDRLLPLITTFEDEVNMDLAPRVGSDAGWFDITGVSALRSKVTPITQTVGAPTLVQSQLMTLNEARADYGLPPLPDGDRMMTVDEIQALRGVVAGGEEPRSAPEPERIPEPPTTREAPEPETRTVDPEERRAAIWTRTDRQATILEGRWEKAMRRLFARQQEATLKRLTGNRGRKAAKPGTRAPADEVFDPAFWEAETVQVTEDLYEAVATASGAQLAADLGVSFDLFDPTVAEFVEARANMLAGQVTDTTYRAITEALAEGVAEGESIPDLAKRVREVFEDATSRRATVIARTEVISAFNGAAVAQASVLPEDVVVGQEWIATRDSRVRPEHSAADGQLVRIGDPFTVGGDSLAYPGDPNGRANNTIQCRCAVAFLTPEDWAEATADRAPWQASTTRAAAVLSMVTPGQQIEPRTLRAVMEVAS